ncbi:patatin-like phospholipase family protein [Tunicatimonas pelagia]|uniref:patatin-like phospholipase family protein n=1 Tax=Tunicatimonas pelagia TaxID=931531 RepID=UPI0026662B35|nr:patatin-like phospholipase family protein [Tunicatimonas pelagia]WKN41311.1 patatin-like phospholipase family protein [Tunicatimonas pelagia]
MKNIVEPLYYSLPVQLLILHVRKNQLLLLCWVLLISIVIGQFGKSLGIPYLFLDPEYLGQVNFFSFLWVGMAFGGFTMAYHITCYILDGPGFGFVGTLSRPFAKFALNNSLIPLFFLSIYLLCLINFQLANEYNNFLGIAEKMAGFFGGLVLIVLLTFEYFRWTNQDIVRLLASTVNRKLKKVRFSRVRIMGNWKETKKGGRRVDNYLDLRLQLRKAPVVQHDKSLVLQVFNQNHLNSVIIELFIFALILVLGIFSSNPLVQIPAAASILLFITVILMMAGAVSFWLKGWATTAVIVSFFLLNIFVRYEWGENSYRAFGLDYATVETEYSLNRLKALNDTSYYHQDYQATKKILDTWYERMYDQYAYSAEYRPKMVLVCTSGGGLRSAMWTTVALQHADSVTDGRLIDHTRLFTGASGGLIGAAYFRELAWQDQRKQVKPNLPIVLARNNTSEQPSIYDPYYAQLIAQDNLNPIIFTLLVNDLMVRNQTFSYGGFTYTKDRGYAFEEQFNKNTHHLLDKQLSDYRVPEQNAEMPMIILTPAIVNDGRKLYISPQHVSYMHIRLPHENRSHRSIIKGVDFRRLLHQQHADSLRFLTALRMNAAFPYVTPNVTLPTSPAIQIMDAGMTDNFGISDALRFMFVFREWINTHTSGVVLLNIRDSEKIEDVKAPNSASLIERMVAPFRFFYDNLFNIQDISNDDRIELAQSWLDVDMHSIYLEYTSEVPKSWKLLNPDRSTLERPSLSWRLTSREKNNIFENIGHPKNVAALNELKKLLATEKTKNE